MTILNIDYIENNEVELKVNPDIAYHVKQNLIENFNEHYLKAVRTEHPKVQFKMKIVTDPNHTPFYFKPRRFFYTERKVINDLIVDMLNQNFIRRSESPYSSPIILTKKKTGEFRLCIDFRCLNKIH